MMKHWAPLTRFLEIPGAPLDNNICERALKKSIIHRKNSLFYKTQNGADVGDMFMSLIQTCNMAQENPFDYLVALQKTHLWSRKIPKNGCPGISGTPYPHQIKNPLRCLDAILNTAWYHPYKKITFFRLCRLTERTP